MSSNYKPAWTVEVIYQIIPTQLKNLDIRAVLTDLDNTLIVQNNPDETEKLLTWILEMKNVGTPVIVVLNNNSEYVVRAVEKFDLLYVARATKPLAKGINIARRQLDLADDEIIMVGDQIITDIHGANRAGIRSILVEPIIATDSWKAQLNRLWEKRIVAYLLVKHPDMGRRGGIK